MIMDVPLQSARFRAARKQLNIVQTDAAQEDAPMATTLNINGKDVVVQSPPDTPLLWVLRDELDMTGTKYGCGIAQCGACTVHLNGQPMRSCQAPIGSLAGVKIATIEGLGGAHPVQAAVDQARRAAVRLLPVRPDHERRRRCWRRRRSRPTPTSTWP